MAGIGFRLRKILSKGTYGSLVSAYFYGAVISCGPWLVSVVSITVLTMLCKDLLPPQEKNLFCSIIIYTYMGTLLFTGPFYMPSTRFLADRMFTGDFGCLLPTFRYLALLCLIGGGMLASGFYLLGGLQPALALGAVALFQAVTLTWVAMIFLSAARDYIAIARVFGFGYVSGILLGYAGAHLAGLPGMLWGFAGGMILLAALLYIRVAREFPTYRKGDSAVTGHWRKMPWLMLCGFCYNAALWADKVIYWIVSGKKAAPGPFYEPLPYDNCFFLAYLTIVPAMTIFLIRIETSFYRDYSEFLGAVSGGAALDSIERTRDNIGAGLRLSIARLLKVQGGITCVCVLFAPYLASKIGLPPDQVSLLRIALITAFVQAMFLISVIVVLYFDWQKFAGLISLLALVANIALTLALLQFGPRYMGFGCLGAFLLALCITALCLETRMRNLVFETFTRRY